MRIGMNVLLWTAAATEAHGGLLADIKRWGYDGVEFPMFTADGSPWKAREGEGESQATARP